MIAAIVAGTSAFAASAALTVRDGDEAGEKLESLVGGDVPAVANAMVLASNLRQVEEMLSEATEGHPWEPGAMRRALGTIDRDWTSERIRYDSVDRKLEDAAFDAVARARSGIDGVRASLDADRHEEARHAMHTVLRPQLHDAQRLVTAFVQASVAHLDETVVADEHARRRAMWTALAINAACALVTVALGAAALRRVRERERLLRTQMAELEVFADRVAHDILGPLTPVSFALSEAARGATEPLQGFVERGKRSLRVVTDIVNGLHAFARSHTGSDPQAHTDVRAVVDDVIAGAAPEAESSDVEVGVGVVDTVVVGCADGVLASIVSNLVRNGIRYMGLRPIRRVTVHVRADGGFARVIVEDTGPGLPPGFEQRAFLPYARPMDQKRSGLGLGLATVKRLAEAHGGSVEFVSSATGSTFEVSLPIWHVPLSFGEETAHA